jgi:hypothetical protein
VWINYIKYFSFAPLIGFDVFHSHFIPEGITINDQSKLEGLLLSQIFEQKTSNGTLCLLSGELQTNVFCELKKSYDENCQEFLEFRVESPIKNDPCIPIIINYINVRLPLMFDLVVAIDTEERRVKRDICAYRSMFDKESIKARKGARLVAYNDFIEKFRRGEYKPDVKNISK